MFDANLVKKYPKNPSTFLGCSNPILRVQARCDQSLGAQVSIGLEAVLPVDFAKKKGYPPVN